MAGRRDYDDDKEKIRQFLEEFTTPDDGTGRKNFKYYDQMVKLAHRCVDEAVYFNEEHAHLIKEFD